jgi:ribosomal protein L22
LAANHNPNDTGHKTVKAATEINYVVGIRKIYSVIRRLQGESTAAAIKSLSTITMCALNVFYTRTEVTLIK